MLVNVSDGHHNSIHDVQSGIKINHLLSVRPLKVPIDKCMYMDLNGQSGRYE